MTPEDRAARRKQRSALLMEQRAHRFRQVFEGKKFRVLDTFKLKDHQEDVISPFGYRLRKGYHLQEIGNDSNMIAVGEQVYRRAQKEFRAVPPLPKKRAKKGEPVASWKLSDLF